MSQDNDELEEFALLEDPIEGSSGSASFLSGRDGKGAEEGRCAGDMQV